MEICKLQDCSGCFACMNICPKGAISVKTDILGKTVPDVDEAKCVSCGLCSKVCPVNNNQEFRKAECSYAVWSKNEEDVNLSSSGGAAAVFSREILEKNGVVFGASVQDGLAQHICIDNGDDIGKLRGSKYVQSFTGYSFKSVKKNLLDGKLVLFIGTPCQIAGLKGYLMKDYTNLITIDLICHGTPPHRYLEEHISVKLKKKTWDSYSFRGRFDYMLTVYDSDILRYQLNRNNDTYFKAFSDSMIFRDNCYNCKYARPERVSDITIGDFWGIDRKAMKNQYNGRISLVLANTEKGRSFFKDCSNEFTYEQRSFEEAANPFQGNLLHPSTPHIERDKFLKNYPTMGFEKAVLKTKLGKKVRNRCFKHYVKMELKRNPLLKKLNDVLKGRI